MNLTEAAAEYQRLSGLLDQGLKFLREQGTEYADAEEAYRHAKADVFAKAPDGTVPQQEAWVGGKTAKERRRRDLADAMRQAALESVRSRRGQISALQSLLAAERAEAEFARTGPHVTA